MITPVITVKFNTTSTSLVSLMTAILATNCVETLPTTLRNFFLARNYLKNIKHSVIITECCEKTNTIGNLSCQNVTYYTGVACENHSDKRMESVNRVSNCLGSFKITITANRIPICEGTAECSLYAYVTIKFL